MKQKQGVTPWRLRLGVRDTMTAAIAKQHPRSGLAFLPLQTPETLCLHVCVCVRLCECVTSRTLQ